MAPPAPGSGGDAEAFPHYTLEQVLLPSKHATVVTEGEPPYRIINVNEEWSRITGYSAEDALGRPCDFLQSDATCKRTTAALMDAVRRKQSIAVQVLNVTRKGRPFLNTLRVAPVVDSSGGFGRYYVGWVQAEFFDTPSCEQTSNTQAVDSLPKPAKRPRIADTSAAAWTAPDAAPALADAAGSEPGPTTVVAAAPAAAKPQSVGAMPSTGFQSAPLSAPPKALLPSGVSGSSGGSGGTGSSGAKDQVRIPPFILKLYQIVDTGEKTRSCISWSQDGSSIIIRVPPPARTPTAQGGP